jgi:hypothetical protein
MSGQASRGASDGTAANGTAANGTAANGTGLLLDRLLDITLTYAIVIIVIAGAYPLLNKQLLETV